MQNTVSANAGSADNPLLDFSGLPRFDAVRPEHVAPAVRRLLDENRALIARLTAEPTPPTWDGFVVPLNEAGERLGRAWGIVGHLHSVLDVPEWREAYNAMLPEVSRFYAEVGHNLALFRKYKALAEGPEYATLSPVRKRILDHELRDFRLSGAELADELKPRFQAIQEELSQLAAKTRAHPSDIDKLIIWGNHSSTQYPDLSHCTVGGKPAKSLVDQAWIEKDFIPTVQQRGAAVIKARGLSSAASAASAAIDHVRDWVLGSNGQWVTMGVPSDGSYGIPEGVMYGVPVTTANGEYTRVTGLEIDAFSRERMDRTLAELEEERAGVAHLL